MGRFSAGLETPDTAPIAGLRDRRVVARRTIVGAHGEVPKQQPTLWTLELRLNARSDPEDRPAALGGSPPATVLEGSWPFRPLKADSDLPPDGPLDRRPWIFRTTPRVSQSPSSGRCDPQPPTLHGTQCTPAHGRRLRRERGGPRSGVRGRRVGGRFEDGVAVGGGGVLEEQRVIQDEPRVTFDAVAVATDADPELGRVPERTDGAEQRERPREAGRVEAGAWASAACMARLSARSANGWNVGATVTLVRLAIASGSGPAARSRRAASSAWPARRSNARA